MTAVGLPAVALCERLVERVAAGAPAPHHCFVPLITRHRSIGRGYFDRTRGDRGYLTDLRLKRYLEPRHYFERNALAVLGDSSLAVQPRPVDRCVERLLRLTGAPSLTKVFNASPFVESALESDVDVVTQTMCFYVNSLGSWEDAATIATAVLRAIDGVPKDDAGGRVLAVSGYALCIANHDTRARGLWQLAHDRLAVAYDRFFLLLRAATAELKRYRDARLFKDAARRAEEEASLLDQNGHTAADNVFAQALVMNLRALESVTEGQYEEAAIRVNRAYEAMALLPRELLTLEPSVAGRYQVMVLENRGLLLARRGHWSEAGQVFEDLVSLARVSEPDSLSEALTLLGFTRLKQGKPLSALGLLEEAETLLADDVLPYGHDVVRRLLAVTYDELGQSAHAAHWIRSCDFNLT